MCSSNSLLGEARQPQSLACLASGELAASQEGKPGASEGGSGGFAVKTLFRSIYSKSVLDKKNTGGKKQLCCGRMGGWGVKTCLSENL